ncbi:MAG: DUF484 family protein [Candidatus Competibacteraceae bacterium]|nr:DUF484 family protein [Candidatus Competibacteraceae bacterium]
MTKASIAIKDWAVPKPRPAQPPADEQLLRENRYLHQCLGVLRAEAAHNEDILGRLQALELAWLEAESLPGLLKGLVTSARAAFRLEVVELVLEDPNHELRHLLALGGHDPDSLEGIRLLDDLETVAPGWRGRRRSWLGPYLGPEHRGLFASRRYLKSVALLPLIRRDTTLGLLALGSGDGSRYTRHHASDFLTHLAAVASVALENILNRERLLHLGLTDLVTNSPNRHALERRLAQETTLSQSHQRPLSCLFLDLDHFKQVNDRYGHLAGDRVLRTVAQRIRSQLRAGDAFGRYGGEEFAVLLPGTRADEAVVLAERLRRRVAAEPVELEDGRQVNVTLSVGVAEAGRAPCSPTELGRTLLAAADAALYRAKAGGRNQVVRA